MRFDCEVNSAVLDRGCPVREAEFENGGDVLN